MISAAGGETFHKDVVAAREHGVQAETLDGTLDDGELTLLVVEGLGDDEREVDVAVVVIYGAASRLAAHKVAAISHQRINIALGERVLILPDNYSTVVLPKVKDDAVGMFNKVILNGDIPIGIGLAGNEE